MGQVSQFGPSCGWVRERRGIGQDDTTCSKLLVVELWAMLQSERIIEQFNAGRKFTDALDRRVLAVAKYEVGPALIIGEDEDEIAVKFEGVDYYSPEDHSDDFWDVVLASDLRERSET